MFPYVVLPIAFLACVQILKRSISLGYDLSHACRVRGIFSVSEICRRSLFHFSFFFFLPSSEAFLADTGIFAPRVFGYEVEASAPRFFYLFPSSSLSLTLSAGPMTLRLRSDELIKRGSLQPNNHKKMLLLACKNWLAINWLATSLQKAQRSTALPCLVGRFAKRPYLHHGS